jgi:hypothetical protein
MINNESNKYRIKYDDHSKLISDYFGNSEIEATIRESI